jgi:hypothetical protein
MTLILILLEHKKWNSYSEGDFARKRFADIKADIEKGTGEEREPEARKEKEEETIRSTNTFTPKCPRNLSRI